MADTLIVFVTCPDEPTAQALAGALVAAKHAACVNIIPAIRSVYRWQDEIQCDNECLMIIKTSRAAYAALEAYILINHPYELPEVLAVGTETGHEKYLQWILSETT